jgi:hypothetical protein
VPITSLISSAKGARVSSTSAVISGSGSITSEKIGISLCGCPMHRAVLHVEIDAGDELAVAAAGDQERVPDLQRLGQRVMGVPGQDHVDPGNGRRSCRSTSKPLWERSRRPRRPRRAPPARPPRSAPRSGRSSVPGTSSRVGDGHVGEGLADHGDLGAAALEHPVIVVDRLVPFDVEDVGPEEGGKGRFSIRSRCTRSDPSVNSQCEVIASTPSAFISVTMSCRAVFSDGSEPCQVSPPSSRSASGRSARIALTTVETRSSPPIRP